VVVLDLKQPGAAPRRLTRVFGSASGLAWGPAGDIWFTASESGESRALRAVTLDGTDRVVAATPAVLTLRDVAPDGRVLVTRALERKAILARAPGQAIERDLSWFDQTALMDLSSDGKSVLLVEAGEAGGKGYRTFLRTTDGAPAVLLGEGSGSSISPDMTLVAVGSILAPAELQLVPTGAGEARSLPAGKLVARSSPFFTPDGKQLVYVGREKGEPLRLWVQDLAGGPPRAITAPGTTFARHASPISPDGRWIVGYVLPHKLVLFPLAGGEPKAIPGLEKDELPAGWGRDGRLYLVAHGELPLRVSLVDVESGARTPSLEIPTQAGHAHDVLNLVVAPGGDAYAYSMRMGLSDLFVAEGL
jgi:hypothetical protein